MCIEEFSRSKRRVFETAVDLFATKTYETVTMADIANALGRKKPSIYSHFASKQEILDIALDFLQTHFFDARRPIEGFGVLIKQAGSLEIIKAINFHFAPQYDELMQKILRIVHQRKYHDPKVQGIFQKIVDGSIAYGRAVLDLAMAEGRIRAVDTLSFATMLHYVRQGTYLRWVIDPTQEHYGHLLEAEDRIFAEMVVYLDQGAPIRQ